MTNKYLDGYVDVPTRLRMALERYPDLRIQETGHDLISIGDRLFLVCHVTVWRTADDPRPSIGSAWEPLPGVTPYTKNSEWMVGFTSALGRALGYMGFGIDKAIASQNEVDARQDAQERPLEAPQRAALGSAGQTDPTGPTKAQLGKLRALGFSGPTPNTKLDASRLIDKLVEAKVASATEEDPF